MGGPTVRAVSSGSGVIRLGHEPGRHVVVLATALALTAAVADLLTAGHITLLFDVCFVVISVGLALVVAPRDFYTVGVLPPLLMVGVFVLVALFDTKAIGDDNDGIAQAVVSGLAGHSLALCAGYGLCLLLLAQRRRVILQASKRVGSPAPSRTTSG